MKEFFKKTYFLFLKIFCNTCYETLQTAAPITLKLLFWQKILGFNRKAYWPMHFTSHVGGVEYIKIGIGTAPGLSFGCYIYADKNNPVYIGDYTIIAPNVLISGYNHDLYDNRKYIGKGGIKIGRYCWIGMNASVLSGVELGDFTVVAAGSVVTKSFPEGYCVIAGNPAKVVKKLEKEKCVTYNNKYEYYGFISKREFEKFSKKHLKVQ